MGTAPGLGENCCLYADARIDALEVSTPPSGHRGPELSVVTLGSDREVVVMIRGELDLCTAPLLRDALAHGRVQGAANVLFDLEQLAFMDLSGLRPLVEFALSGRDGVEVRFTPGPRVVQRLMAIAGIGGRLTFVAPPA